LRLVQTSRNPRLHITANQTCIPDRNDRTLNHPAEKADLEARPHAALAVDGDIPALSVKDRFSQRQPDADAVLARVRAAVKAVEDVGQVCAGDAFAVVADDDLDVEGVGGISDLDLPTFRGVIHTVFDHVGQGFCAPVEVAGKARAIIPVDSTLIPTGEMMKVAGTPFDFRAPTPIGARIDSNHIQLKYGRGYDHTWVLDRADQTSLVRAAHVTEPTTGRTLDIYTTEPGVQFYTGNFLDGTAVGKSGHVYKYRYGLALETHHFPDSPNQPSFPSVILRPGQVYRTKTVFKLGTTP